MKKLVLLSLISLLLLTCQSNRDLAQQTACCYLEENASAEFATFANDQRFSAKHDEPLVINFKGSGKMIGFPTNDGKKANAYLIKAKAKSKKYLVVIHEWWGLNDHIKKESERYFKALGENINVIALDMYDGKVATTRENAAKYMQSTKQERAEAIIQGAFTYMGKKAKVASIGWCFGGGWSLQTSILAGKRSKACIMYYGMPEKDTKRLKKLKAAVLGIFASREKWITTEIVKKFEENMKSLKKEIQVKNYDAEHAFANPSNPNYHKVYADEAFGKSIKFLKERL